MLGRGSSKADTWLQKPLCSRKAFKSCGSIQVWEVEQAEFRGKLQKVLLLDCISLCSGSTASIRWSYLQKNVTPSFCSFPQCWPVWKSGHVLRQINLGWNRFCSWPLFGPRKSVLGRSLWEIQWMRQCRGLHLHCTNNNSWEPAERWAVLEVPLALSHC